MPNVSAYWKTGFVLAAASILAAAQPQEGVTSWNPLEAHVMRRSLDPDSRRDYLRAIELTADMARDPQALQLARERGLDVLNLTWEDTGRYKGSSVGPSISDMTIQVGYGRQDLGSTGIRCMPVVRYPNFSDKTCDVDPSDFTLLVGNDHGRPLRRVSLREFLANPDPFLTKPNSWPGTVPHTLLAPRDSKVLVSAQACFLPVPKEGLATFNPVLFNYQSVSGDPAVLTVLATREGTSTTVIDNKRDSFSEGSVWGQRLFHNADGQRASLTGQRLSEFSPSEGEVSKGPGLSMVLLIQIPLRQRYVRTENLNSLSGSVTGGIGGIGGGAFGSAGRGGVSNVESAVIGHGENEGEFTEIAELPIQRDPNFPVRVTVQFYKATSNGVVTETDIDAIKHDIDAVYAQGENVGSLVVGGYTGRPTEYYGCKQRPASWWSEFWQRYEENTGVPRAEAVDKLRKLLGPDYYYRPVSELYLRDLLPRERG